MRTHEGVGTGQGLLIHTSTAHILPLDHFSHPFSLHCPHFMSCFSRWGYIRRSHRPVPPFQCFLLRFCESDDSTTPTSNATGCHVKTTFRNTRVWVRPIGIIFFTHSLLSFVNYAFAHDSRASAQCRSSLCVHGLSSSQGETVSPFI